MIKYISYLFLAFFSSITYGQEANEAFKITPEHPKPGSEATIRYNANSTVLQGKDHIEGVMYTYANYQWTASDVEMQKTADEVWESTFNLDKDASFLTFAFQADTLIDKGEKFPYSWIIPESPGGYWAWGLVRSKTLKEETPDMVNNRAYISDTLALMWVNNELKYHPKSREHIFYEALQLMKNVRSENPVPRIKNEIRTFLGMELNLQQQNSLDKTLGMLAAEEHQKFLDSVKQVVLTKYPNGVYARDKEILSLFRESDFEKKASGFEEFQKKFPAQKFENSYTDIEDLYYEKLYKSIAYGYLMNDKSYEFIFNNLDNAPYTLVLDYHWHLVSIPNNRETATPDSLYALSQKFIPKLEAWETKIPKAYKGKLSPKQWQDKALEMNAAEYLTYAGLLEKTERFKEAEKYLQKLAPVYGYSNAEFNGLYTQYMMRKESEKAAVEYIKNTLKQNAATPAMLAILREDYVANGRKESDFEQYLEGLKSEEQVAQQETQLLEELINKPIEGFTLKNLQGETVSLKDQKGKIVVIDMWATWCAPCKKAMPGMELAVNRYAEDDEVVFYFLDTQEYVADYKEKVKAFITEKNYPFNVLFDGQNPETGKMDQVYANYARAFSFSGIPQKMIIDKNGRLRWRSTGYAGKPNQLADEISFLIDHLKNE